METRYLVLLHLKRQGSGSVPDVAAALGRSANTVRQHLQRLLDEGVVRADGVVPGRRSGRAARRYVLTQAAESTLPKRFPELLVALVPEAERLGVVDALLDGAVRSVAASERPTLVALAPRMRLLALLRAIGYDDMLPLLTLAPAAWRLLTHDCPYREVGCRVEGLCDLLPRIVTRATDLQAERVSCQRDGDDACTFEGSLTPG